MITTQVSDLPAKVEHWYNTVNLEDLELLEAVRKCKNQENAVYSFFKKRPYHCFTPAAVLRFLIVLHPDVVKPGTPVTSIRRAITNLTKAGLLVKTDDKIIEGYGVANHLWRLYVPEVKPIQIKIPFE